MPNHYLKFEILKLSSITVECCISVSVLNLIHQESNHPIMFIFFGYWLHLFCLLCSVLITKTALLDCMPPENVSCVLITQAGKFKWQSLRWWNNISVWQWKCRQYFSDYIRPLKFPAAFLDNSCDFFYKLWNPDIHYWKIVKCSVHSVLFWRNFGKSQTMHRKYFHMVV